MRLIGFNYIEETTVALDLLNQHYEKIHLHSNKRYLISSTCSTINFLVQKYYPELNQYMISMFPPMMVHGKLLKEKYGKDSKVIFIGPCVAAKTECNEYIEELPLIDGTLTFQEVENWLKENNIFLNDLQDGFFDQEGSRNAKLFPVEGFTIDGNNLPYGKKLFKICGLENTKEILNSMLKEELEPAYVEINYCLNGCINGPVFYNSSKGVFLRKKLVNQYSEKFSYINSIDYTKYLTDEFKREFKNKKVKQLIPNIVELRKILKEMGKFKEKDEINCGTCGYDTCRDKAIAVYNNMDKTEMCLPYIRNKIETISNLIFEHSPNLIFLVNRNLKIISMNPSAVKHLNVDMEFNGDLHLATILDFYDYSQVFEKKESMCGKKVRLETQNLTVIQNLLYIEEQDVILAILNDITKEEEKEKELIKVKKDTANMVQDVITKQMLVVQEICSVLGETTAETKVVLKKFLDVILENSEDY